MANITKQIKILVMGCSSAGKSTFISSTLIPVLLENQYAAKRTDIEVFFAADLRENYHLGKKKCVIVHYNCLMQTEPSPHAKEHFNKNDYFLSNILGDDFDEIFYCYTPDDLLMARVNNRVFVEPKILKDRISKYPKKHIVSLLNKISQRKVLLEAYGLLRDLKGNFSIVFSQSKTSMVISISDFIEAPRSVFLQTVLSDKKCDVELLQPHLKSYSELSAECAQFIAKGKNDIELDKKYSHAAIIQNVVWMLWRIAKLFTANKFTPR